MGKKPFGIKQRLHAGIELTDLCAHPCPFSARARKTIGISRLCHGLSQTFINNHPLNPAQIAAVSEHELRKINGVTRRRRKRVQAISRRPTSMARTRLADFGTGKLKKGGNQPLQTRALERLAVMFAKRPKIDDIAIGQQNRCMHDTATPGFARGPITQLAIGQPGRNSDVTRQICKRGKPRRFELAEQAARLHKPLRSLRRKSLATPQTASRIHPEHRHIVDAARIRDVVQCENHTVFLAQAACLVYIRRLAWRDTRRPHTVGSVEFVERALDGAAHRLAKGLPRVLWNAPSSQKSAA